MMRVDTCQAIVCIARHVAMHHIQQNPQAKPVRLINECLHACSAVGNSLVT